MIRREIGEKSEQMRCRNGAESDAFFLRRHIIAKWAQKWSKIHRKTTTEPPQKSIDYAVKIVALEVQQFLPCDLALDTLAIYGSGTAHLFDTVRVAGRLHIADLPAACGVIVCEIGAALLGFLVTFAQNVCHVLPPFNPTMSLRFCLWMMDISLKFCNNSGFYRGVPRR